MAMLCVHDLAAAGASLRDIAGALLDPMPDDWRSSWERSDLRRLSARTLEKHRSTAPVPLIGRSAAGSSIRSRICAPGPIAAPVHRPDPYDARMNMIGGAMYLAQLAARYGMTGSLAAYNAGPGQYER